MGAGLCALTLLGGQLLSPIKSLEDGRPLGYWGRGHTRASGEPACRGQVTELPVRDAVLG